jgi:hypothetical protein
MIVNLDFELNAWIKQLYVEAESVEAAKQKLMNMSLAEIIEDSTCVVASDIKFTDIDANIVEYDLDVKVTGIEFDFDPEILDVSVIEYLKGILPKERTFTLHGVTDRTDVDDMVSDYLFAETDYEPKSFNVQVLKQK